MQEVGYQNHPIIAKKNNQNDDVTSIGIPYNCKNDVRTGCCFFEESQVVGLVRANYSLYPQGMQFVCFVCR